MQRFLYSTDSAQHDVRQVVEVKELEWGAICQIRGGSPSHNVGKSPPESSLTLMSCLNVVDPEWIRWNSSPLHGQSQTETRTAKQQIAS